MLGGSVSGRSKNLITMVKGLQYTVRYTDGTQGSWGWGRGGEGGRDPKWILKIQPKRGFLIRTNPASYLSLSLFLIFEISLQFSGTEHNGEGVEKG
jgi:hypothetical protein